MHKTLMQPPVRREALRERDRLDLADDLQAYARETPAQRIGLALALMQMARKLAQGTGATWVKSPPDDLAEKAERYIAPLRRLKAG